MKHMVRFLQKRISYKKATPKTWEDKKVSIFLQKNES